jgi:hypothetical protein
LGAPGGLSLKAIDFGQKPKAKDKIFLLLLYFMKILTLQSIFSRSSIRSFLVTKLIPKSPKRVLYFSYKESKLAPWDVAFQNSCISTGSGPAGG